MHRNANTFAVSQVDLEPSTSAHFCACVILQGKHDEAESLHKRSQAIQEKALGPDHTSVADSARQQGGIAGAAGETHATFRGIAS